MTIPTGKTAADFDFKLGQVPISWQQPIADVIDTFDVVQVGLKSIGIDDPFVVTKAVELVIDRHDRLTAERHS
jgi:hypothetical protein